MWIHVADRLWEEDRKFEICSDARIMQSRGPWGQDQGCLADIPAEQKTLQKSKGECMVLSLFVTVEEASVGGFASSAIDPPVYLVPFSLTCCPDHCYMQAAAGCILSCLLIDWSQDLEETEHHNFWAFSSREWNGIVLIINKVIYERFDLVNEVVLY